MVITMNSVKVFVGKQSIRTSQAVFKKLAWHRVLANCGIRDGWIPRVAHLSSSPPLFDMLSYNDFSDCMACPISPKGSAALWTAGGFIVKKDVVAHRVQALRRSAQSVERLRTKLDVAGGVMTLEGDVGTRIVPRGRSINSMLLRKAVHEAAMGIKGNKIMLTQYGMAPAKSPETDVAREEEARINSDPNYQAYINELEELEDSGFEGFVAYANGKRIARSKDFDDLIKEIGRQQEDVLIQEIPAKVIDFRLPFQVET